MILKLYFLILSGTPANYTLTHNSLIEVCIDILQNEYDPSPTLTMKKVYLFNIKHNNDNNNKNHQTKYFTNIILTSVTYIIIRCT